MNKSVMVAVLVIAASLATVGSVFADHYPPAGASAARSAVAFEQYQAAIEHMEASRDAALARTRVSSMDRFSQYLWALEQMQKKQDAALFAAPAARSDDSILRWEQYLEHAK